MMKFGVFAVLCFSAFFATTARAQEENIVKEVICEGTTMMTDLLAQFVKHIPNMEVFVCPLYKAIDGYCSPDKCRSSCNCQKQAGSTTETSNYTGEGITESPGSVETGSEAPKSKPLLNKSKGLKSKSKHNKSKNHAKSKHTGKSKNAKGKHNNKP